MTTDYLEAGQAMPIASLTTLVALAGDEPTVRRMGAALARDGALVVARGHDLVELATACRDRQPHVAVLAWAAYADAPGALRRLAAALPRTRLAVVMREHTRRETRRALQAGVDGIIVDSQLALTLAVVVRAVALGQSSIPRSARRDLDAPALSFRERQVLALVSDGLSNAQVAGRLCLAESTVKSHLTSLFTKLGVRSREEATALHLEGRRQSQDNDSNLRGHEAHALNGGFA